MTTTLKDNALLATGALPFNTPEEWQNFFEKFGANGRTYSDFTQLTPESMEIIYMLAYNHYNAGKYAEAEKVFQLLSFLNHFERRFWTGLGASREQLKKYDEAIKAYGFLAMLDMKDPHPPLLMAKCYLGQGKEKNAVGALEACAFIAGSKPEHAAIKEQAQHLLELLAKAEETTASSAP